jgi:quercetin dioxygenase-like cupin family protein
MLHAFRRRFLVATDDGVIVLGPGEGRSLNRRQDRGFVLKVGKDFPNAAYTLIESHGPPPGQWVPPHIHHVSEETWYVLDGVLTIRVGDRTIKAVEGSFVCVPRGLVHSFGNTGVTPAHFLQIHSPAGIEAYFDERSALAAAMPAVDTQDYFMGLDREFHAALAKKYDMEFV